MPEHHIFIDPARPRPRFRPFKALNHMKKLTADKEDTQQVFYIIEALNGNALRRSFNKSIRTEQGRARLTERRDLATLLDDHEALGDLPAGSVGRAYIDFMTREGLTAAGLVEESQILQRGKKQFDDDLAWFGGRQRDTHDMFHVLTGYGRDALGEAALLAFTHSQSGGRGIFFISKMAFRQMRQAFGRSLNLKAVYKEARANGKAAARIADQDIVAMLGEPIGDVRARLKVAKPVAYRAALKTLSDMPLDANGMLAA